jgi:hypothetical protein
MRAGIVCEGPGDFAVLRNLLCGVLNIDSSDIIPVRPHIDATEKSQQSAGQPMAPNEHSNLTLVKEECINKGEINKFLSAPFVVGDSRKILIIQIDTDVCENEGYDVARPKKTGDLEAYTRALRDLVVAKIIEWLQTDAFDNFTIFAITIEETEAWLIPLYNKDLRRDTSYYNDPKSELDRIHKKKGLGNFTKYEQMQILCAPIKKRKNIEFCGGHNESLRLFVEDLTVKDGALPVE